MMRVFCTRGARPDLVKTCRALHMKKKILHLGSGLFGTRKPRTLSGTLSFQWMDRPLPALASPKTWFLCGSVQSQASSIVVVVPETVHRKWNLSSLFFNSGGNEQVWLCPLCFQLLQQCQGPRADESKGNYTEWNAFHTFYWFSHTCHGPSRNTLQELVAPVQTRAEGETLGWQSLWSLLCFPSISICHLTTETLTWRLTTFNTDTEESLLWMNL